MAYLQLHGKQYSVPAEGLTVGCHEGAGLRLSGDDATARAVVTLATDGSAVIRRDAPDAVIFVNGVQLGMEPSPILHGDKVEMAGEELRYGDDKQGGSTQFVSGAQVADMARAAAAAPAKPTLARGGRLVSLIDGREYTIPDDGITMGREVGNDIVIPSSEVSRRHAEVVPMPGGYHLTDHSTNGLFVNGVRVAQLQVLGRGDVVKVGPEEFRFYADAAKAASATASATTPAVAPAADCSPDLPIVLETAFSSATSVPAAPSAAPEAPVAPAAPAASVAPLPVVRAPLATLEITSEGPLKGATFEILAALTNVGRGAHNDVTLADESVSDSHAKIQKREAGWFIVDQDSTNGTYVGGGRVHGERPVDGAQGVRFGGVEVMFRPLANVDVATGGTRAIAAVTVDPPRKPASVPRPRPVPAEAKKKGCAAMIAFLMSLTVAGASMLAALLTTGQ